MAIQKHNIYYDASKPESGIYYYAENGEQKELFLNNVLSGENGISAISAVDGNTWVIGITDDYKDNIEKIPGLSDNFVILSADVGNKLYVSATDNWDVLPYTGSTNISIHDHIIDFQNTANLIGDDTHIAVVSADNNIVVSALKDFVDEEYVDEAIASSVSGKFDSSAFNTYSGNINSIIEDLNTNKLDITATNDWDITPYSAGNGVNISGHTISVLKSKPLTGDDKNIEIVETDDFIIVSGLKDFVDKEYVDNAIASAAPTSAVANKLDKAVFSAYSADIVLQLNNISADKLDTSAFTAYSAHALDDYYKTSETSGKQEIQNALDEKQDNLTNEQLSAISSVSAIQSISANWLTEEDIEDFITEDEVESVSSTLTAQTNYLSGIIDTKLDKTEFDTYTATALDDYYTKDETKGLINDLSGTVSSQLNNKLDTSTFAAYSGNINNQINTVSSEVDKKLYTSATNDWDVTPYSGINGIKVENHLISVSANYALSADVYSKSQIDDIIANFGGFQIVSEDAQGKPDVSDPSTKIIYLTLVDDDPAAFDKYREWIWTNSEWECIGIASIDLKDYAKTQDVITSAVATSAWINNTFYNKTETSGKTEIQNALDTKLDTTAFDNYSDNIDEQLQALSSVKLDTSAFTAYSADIESQLDTLSAIKLDKTYSATVNEQLTAKLDTSAFTAYSAEINTELNNITADVDKKLYTSATDNWDYIAYSGGQNVSIVDHIIDISGTKSLSGDGKNIEVVELADTFIISATKDIVDKSYVDNNFVSKTDFGTYSGNTKNQIDSKLNKSDFDNYSATALNDYYKKSETSGKTEIQDALAEKQDNLTNEQLSAISSVSAIQSNTENWNAAYDTLTAYSADGKWLIADDITALATKNEVEIASGVLTAQTNYLSGIIDTKLDTITFTAYSAHALDNYYNIQETDNLIDDLSATVDNRLTNKLDTSAFTAYSADVKTQIDSKLNKSDFDDYSAHALADYYTKNETDVEITDAINDISATVSADYLKKADVQEYTAGNNIDITNYVISGRDWTPELNTKVNNIDFTAYSADAKIQIDSKLNKSDFDDYSAHALDNYYTKSETSGKNEIQNALDEKQDNLSNEQLSAISSVSAIQAISGDWTTKTEVENTSAILTAQTNYLSGIVDNKLDTTAFNTYTAAALVDYYTKSETNTLVDNSIADISATVSADYLKKADVREYTAGNNIDVTNYVISGRDWTPELNTKVNNSDFTIYSGNVNDLITAVSANTTALSANKLDTTAFNDYSDNIDSQLQTLSSVKLDTSAFTTYSAHALDNYYTKPETNSLIDDLSATVSSNYVKNTDIHEYTAGNNIDITNYVVSGKDWTPELNTKVNSADFTAYSATVDSQLQNLTENKLDKTEFDTYSASTKTQIDSKLNKSDFDDYSAHALVDYYTKDETSGSQQIADALNTKLNKTDFDNYSAQALNDYYKKSETSGKIEIQNALDTKLNTSAFTAYSGNVDTLLNNISANTTALSANKLDISAFTAYSATAFNDYYTKSETDTEITNAINDISATVSADYLKKADVKEYTAGDNIDITNYVISGKDWIPELNTKVNNTDFNTYSASTKTQIDSKLNKTDFNTYSAHADTTPYSGINGIKVENHLISVSANYALSADVYSKSEVDNIRDNIAKELAGLGFYDCKSDEIKANGEPNETVLEARELLSNNKIYLVKDNTAPVPDQYKEWIWDGTNWTCIGDTSISLAAYAKTQDVIASAIATSAWINDTFYDKTETSGKQQIQDALNTKLNTSIFTAYSANVKTQIDSKLNKSDFDDYSAHALDDYYKKSETSGKIEIQTALGTKLDTTAFNDYTVTALNNYYTKDETSGKTEIQNALNTKLDTTAFNDYTATALNDIAANSGNWNASYTALTANSGNWNNTYNTVTTNSGKWENSYTALTANSASWLKEADVTGFATKTELNNASSILINQDNYLSGVIDTKLDTTAFNNYSAHALDNYYKKSETSGKTEIQNALGTKLDTNAFTTYSADIKTQIDSKLNKTEFNTYSAIVDNDIDYISAAVSNIPAQVQSDWEETNTTSPAYIQNKPVDLEMSAGNGISITETNNILVFAVSGNYADATEVDTDINYLSGIIDTKLDTTAFNNYSANVKTQIDSKLAKNDFDSYSAIIDTDIDYLSAAINDIPAQVQSDWEETNIASPAYIQNKPVDLEMSAGNGISITETNNTLVFAVSGNYADATEVNNKLTALSANKLDISATTGWDISAYSAGNNITIVDHVIDLRESKNLIGDGENIIVTESGSNIIVSALKDILDKDDFDSYSAIIDDDIDYLSAAIEDSILSVGTDLKIENGIISVNTNGTANSAYMAFVEGSATIASGKYSHAEGGKTSAIGTFTHAEGTDTKAAGEESHAEGWGTFASGHNSHAEGKYTTAAGSNSHAEGDHTLANYCAHAEGDSTSADGSYSHAEGQKTIASNNGAHAEGGWTVAKNNGAHAEGLFTSAIGYASHTEGYRTSAAGMASHAEGYYASALSDFSHAEGGNTLASQSYSHAEGLLTSAIGYISHAEGSATLANGSFTHAEGYGTSALLTFSHAEGNCTIANSYAMHAEGMYNKTSADALFVIGNGTADDARSDAFIITNTGLASATILATSGISDIEAAITSIPAQVQTDWEETNTTSPAYIQNKPDDLEMSAGNGISITEVNDTLIFSVSGKLDTTAFNGYSAEIDTDIDYISAAIEDSCVKYNDIQYAIGTANTAAGSTTARYSVALGNSNSAYNSFVIGNYNKGKESYIFGNSNSGINSYIFGYNCTGTESYLFGKDLSGKSWGIELGDFGDTGYPVIVGRQNATKTSAYFVVGCGNTLGNADAFIVSSNKVASAADFKAGNGVSLSSLTGLATSSWVNTHYGKKTNDVYYIKPDLPYDLYSSTATYAVGDKVVCTAGSGSLYSAKSAVTTPGAWSANSGKFAGVSNVTFTAENEDITELYDGLKIALYLPSRLAATDSYLNINGLGDVPLYKNNYTKLTSGYFPTSGAVIDFTYVSATNRWVWADYDSNSTYAGMVDAYVMLSASATNISAACTNFSAKPGNTINVTFPRNYTAVSAKKFRAGTTTYQPLYLNGSATSNTNYLIPSGTWPVYYDGNNWYLWTDGSIQFSAIRSTVVSATTLATSGIPDIEAAITSIPAQVQSDWSATNTASPAYIQNKPDVLIPVDSPAALGGISKPINIMVVSAMPASPDSATIYLVQGTMIGN